MSKPCGGDAWWDAAWSPVGGCTPIAPGCRWCYAPRLIAPYIHGWANDEFVLHDGVVDQVGERYVFNGTLTVLPDGHKGWSWPLKWAGVKQPLLGPGQRSLIFVVDMADLFHEDRPTPIIR